MITAKIIGKEPKGSFVDVRVEFFKDGQSRLIETFKYHNKEQFDTIIKQKINQLQKIDTALGEIQEGDYSPLPSKEETPEEMAKRQEEEFNKKVDEAFWQLDRGLITKEQYEVIITNLKSGNTIK